MPSADATPQLTLDTFEDASKRVKEVTQETKLIYSPHFSKETSNDVYLKSENMQRTAPTRCAVPTIRSQRFPMRSANAG